MIESILIANGGCIVVGGGDGSDKDFSAFGQLRHGLCRSDCKSILEGQSRCFEVRDAFGRGCSFASLQDFFLTRHYSNVAVMFSVEDLSVSLFLCHVSVTVRRFDF